MSQKVNMDVFLYYLLITQKMNDFTVSEAKEKLFCEKGEFASLEEARKYIYRQLSRNIKTGMLKRTDHFDAGVKKVLYSTTEKFFLSKIVPIRRLKKSKKIISNEDRSLDQKSNSYQILLENELKLYEIDLNANIEEAKEYKRLTARFPELKARLQRHQLQARSESTEMIGKIRAIQKLLGHKVSGYEYVIEEIS
ncbi:hypothetical protein DS885_15235 [Psychromonas sp. B3M02]|uniref:hypothetical protein n=1 Tax=Psychromonas sp. B3M02 TaxID=2267226 RepID=UPI000DEAF60C|nr:hypothetical protein [Psychromonas sp. B3M02]RBW42583.1 hypothetical protein DS885_15235 [Psychromonas sp. B3M02]